MPDKDDTYHSNYGEFALIIASNDQKSGLLQLANPFAVGKVYCLRLDFYLYAEERSSLDVVVESGNRTYFLYRAYEANMIKWRVARIEVSLADKYDWLRIKGSVMHGALALGLIQSWNGPCSGDNNQQVHGRHFCDFELNSTCMFKPGGPFPQQWRVIRGSDVTPYPVADHTTHTRNGHFFGLTFQLAKQIAGHQVTRDDKFKLYFNMTKVQTECLRFSYYLAGNSTIFYGLFQYDQGHGQRFYQDWKVTGSTYGTWFTHQNPYPPQNQYGLLMGISFDPKTEGNAAFIDDILLDSASCITTHACTFEVKCIDGWI